MIGGFEFPYVRKLSERYFKKKDLFIFTYKMAEAFETVDVILTAEQAQHINERHVNLTQHAKTSRFFLTFNLSSTLGLLSRRTWEGRDDVELIDQRWKRGHCNFYLYVFDVGKFVGLDPWGYPC